MWGLILALLIAIGIAGFASLNSITVSVDLFFWKAPEVSLALVVLFSVLTGVILAALFAAPRYLKNMQKIAELERKIRHLESPPAPKEPWHPIETGAPGGEISHEEEKKEQNPSQD